MKISDLNLGKLIAMNNLEKMPKSFNKNSLIAYSIKKGDILLIVKDKRFEYYKGKAFINWDNKPVVFLWKIDIKEVCRVLPIIKRLKIVNKKEYIKFDYKIMECRI